MTAAEGELEQLAGNGDCDAQLALARRLEAEGRTAAARAWFARAAKQGSVAGLRALAINLLTREPVMGSDGVNMIRSAAHKGDAEAAFVCGLLAAQDCALENRWNVALECLARAAECGWAPARAQLDFLGGRDAAAQMSTLSTSLPVRNVCESPRIGVIEGCATAEICDWLIALARPRLARARVYDQANGGARVEHARNNSSVAFDIAHSDIVLMSIRARIAAIANLPESGLEDSTILHYAPGQQFEPHFDFLDPGVPGYAPDVARHGQRVATFLLSLNDEYEGGETDFPKLDWRWKGRKGDALLFWNVVDSREPDMRTLHAGRPPASGEKWLLSQWLRGR
jgi:prolyl 4-hydroxylase